MKIYRKPIYPWQVKPLIHFGLKEKCPYIWFLWWLINLERDLKTDRLYITSISYLPD
jgi:hypothetical protein